MLTKNGVTVSQNSPFLCNDFIDKLRFCYIENSKNKIHLLINKSPFIYDQNQTNFVPNIEHEYNGNKLH